MTRQKKMEDMHAFFGLNTPAIPLEEVVVNEDDDEVDDLLSEASDLLFVNNNEAAVEMCKQALAKNPTKDEAFNLLSVALINLGRFEDAKLTTLTWKELQPDNITQLAMQLRASYLAEDLSLCSETAAEVLRFSDWEFGPNPQLRFLAYLLAVDLQADIEPSLVSQLALSALTDEDRAIDTSYGDLSDKVVHLWADVCTETRDDGEAYSSLSSLIDEQDASSSQSPGFELAIALMGVYHLKRLQIEEVNRLLAIAQKHGKKDSVNVRALAALLAVEQFTENPDGVETPEKEDERERVRKMLVAAETSHLLLRRRIFRYL